MDRLALTRSLTTSEFAAWYWLKQELVVFCRRERLGTSGSKLELQARISACLAGLPSVAAKSKATRRDCAMPTDFTLDTVIGPGWRCNPALGAYMRTVCGSGFHFNQAMREFIHAGVGQTLSDAAICYHASVRPARRTRPIAAQLEYNQHFRDYFAAHPRATRKEAIDAWWKRRGRPRERSTTAGTNAG